MEDSGDISREPLQYRGTSDKNIHELKVSPTQARLAPGNKLLFMALPFIPLGALLIGLAKGLDADPGLQTAAWLFPLFGGGALLLGWVVMHHVGLRATFDLRGKRVQIRGGGLKGPLSMGLGLVEGVQLLDGGTRRIGRGSQPYQAYQLILVLAETARSPRLLLLDNGGRKELRQMAKELAGALDVPFLNHVS